jgi:hypothetical protein
VVPGRGADEAPLSLRRRELRDEVHASTDLERPGRLVILVLHPDLGADQFREPGIAVDRRPWEIFTDTPTSFEDVAEGRSFQSLEF